MAIKLNETLYIVHHKPVNRQQRKIAQKELEKIQREVLSIVLSYLEEENKTDELRLLAKEHYLKRVKVANKGNNFITADPYFFDTHFPTKRKIDQITKPSKKASVSAIILVSLLSVIAALILVSVFFA